MVSGLLRNPHMVYLPTYLKICTSISSSKEMIKKLEGSKYQCSMWGKLS